MPTDTTAHPAPSPRVPSNSVRALRVFVASSTLFVLGSAAAAVAARALHHPVASGTIAWLLVLSTLLSLPLLIGGLKLIRRDDEGPITGIAGAVVGGVAVTIV